MDELLSFRFVDHRDDSRQHQLGRQTRYLNFKRANLVDHPSEDLIFGGRFASALGRCIEVVDRMFIDRQTLFRRCLAAATTVHFGRLDFECQSLDVTHSPWPERRQCSLILAMSKKTDVLIRFGERVRKLRKEQGYSQEAFAAKCGLDRTYYGGIERGERNVAIRNIEVIATALGLSLAELMAGV